VEVTVKKSESRAGWADVVIRFVAENRGEKPFMGSWPYVGTLKVKEGNTAKFAFDLTSRGFMVDYSYPTQERGYHENPPGIIPP